MLAYDLIESDLDKMKFLDQELVCKKVEQIASTFNLLSKNE
ncbi:hypothetical protein [Bacillus sp. JCM 19041]